MSISLAVVKNVYITYIKLIVEKSQVTGFVSPGENNNYISENMTLWLIKIAYNCDRGETFTDFKLHDPDSTLFKTHPGSEKQTFLNDLLFNE